MSRGVRSYPRIIQRALYNHRGLSLGLFLACLSISAAASISVVVRSSSEQNPAADYFDYPQDFSSNTLTLSPSREFSRSSRPIFPYSIVAGGVKSVKEIKEAVARDPAIAKHYSVLKMDDLRLVRVEKPRAVYVSYRKGSNIYWTRQKLTLAPGESLLTDGENMVRVRCGNLVSPSPKPPNSPEEPTAVTFDTPLVPPPPAAMPPLVLTSNPGRVFFPPFVPLFPGDGPGKRHHGPPVHIPEPSTLVMLLTGFALLWAVSKARSQ